MTKLTSELIVRLTDLVSGPAGKAAGALKGVGSAGRDLSRLGGSGSGPKRLAGDLDGLGAKLERIKAFRLASKDLDVSGLGFRRAQADLQRLGRELDAAKAKAAEFSGVRAFSRSGDIAREMTAARTRLRELQGSYVAAKAAAEAAGGALKSQGSAVRALRGDLAAAGIPIDQLRGKGRGLPAAVEATTAAMIRQGRAAEIVARRSEIAAQKSQRAADMAHAAAERSEVRRRTLGTLAGGAGAIAAYRGKEIGKKAVVSAAEFDIGIRKQRAFTDVSEENQAPLTAQAKKIGQETQFSNLDVVKAQTKAMQGLPAGFPSKLKAEVAQGILENVKNYALVMEADLETSTEAIRSYLQTTGKDISTKEKALAEARLATNQIVKMAKLGGMSDDDVQGYMKFAASSGTAAGLSSETLMALGALARRGGLRGDEAGTFMRTASSKIVSPTRQGIAALNAAGINFNDYVHMPDQLSTGNLENQFRTTMGKGFTPDVRKKIDVINSDKKLISDRERYVQAVTEAVEPILGKKKDGTVRASDSKVAAKAATTFHKVSAKSVDSERLWGDAMEKNLTLPQLNAWLTDKHGGKGAITQRQWDEFKASRDQIKKAGDDPDFASNKAKDIMAGLGGSFENLKGSVDNLITSIGTANEGILKLSFDKVGALLDSFSSLSTTSQKVVSALGALAAAGAGLYGAWKVAGNLLGGAGLAGSATALTGSAAALTEAAAALAASARLGGAAGAATAGAAGAGATGAAAGGGAAAAGSGPVAKAAAGIGTVARLAARWTVLPALVTGAVEAAGDQFGYREASGPGSRGFGRAVRREMDERYGPRPTDAAEALPGTTAPGPSAGSFSLSGPREQAAAKPAGGVSLPDIAKAKDALDALGSTVTPTINATSLDAAEIKAKEAKVSLDALGATVSPQVDMAQMNALGAKAVEILATFRQIGSVVSSVSAGAGKLAASAAAASAGSNAGGSSSGGDVRTGKVKQAFSGAFADA